ncbi:class I SAM-dependent methyltransferase [Rhizobium sullae]|uniref:class I SAM-dependent methyltransferase n=1 Tax=Rhizobium sullae TaxID=50338 RepID=UPI000B34C094|nr:class I SAM-dependent methyltransferase [Rhizobium sullae]
MRNLYEAIKGCIPSDHSRQMYSRSVVASLVENGFSPQTILDLGCGDGRSLDMFRSLTPSAKWTGLDIEKSPEVDERVRKDGEFVTYNGVNIPFRDGSFDLIYSHQVLEHVRYPEKVLAEANRVCRSGGRMVISTSQLEPYHSYSFWNFTVFGLHTILTGAGFKVVEMRPGIDGQTLINRALSHNSPEYSAFFNSESPVNQKMEEEPGTARDKNFRKLRFCGHIIAVCFKP